MKRFTIRFFCPECGQQVRPKDGFRFECKHKGTPKEKGKLSDPDKYLIDEIVIEMEGG